MDTLPGLETFLALAREGSFSGAARVLGVPRSTVSRRIARLEEALGETLVERTTRNVALTDAGRVLRDRGAVLVDEMRAVVDDVAQIRNEPRGTLRIAAPPGFGRDFMVDFLVAFRERYPRVHVELRVTSRLPHLLDDDFDLVLREGPVADAPWIVRSMGPADRILVASPEYLEARGTPRSVGDLGAHTCIGLVDEGTRGDVWPLRDGGGLVVRPVLRSNDLDVVRQAALAGLGLAVLPVLVTFTDLLAGRLVPVLAGEVGVEAQLLALYPPGRRGSPKLQAFFDLAEEVTARVGRFPGAGLIPSLAR